jgi:uncharacterized protein
LIGMTPARLSRLPSGRLGSGLRVAFARGVRARLLGLALLRDPPAGWALLIPRCRSVHTYGMRFALDVVFFDSRGEVARVVLGVPPGRVVSCRRAAAVLEAPAGEIERRYLPTS